MLRDILIVGGGISGICSALALYKALDSRIPDLRIRIFERHPVLSTSGGALNLTPVAQRHLTHLGVLQELDNFGSEAGLDVDAIEIFSVRTGKALGSIDFTDQHGQGYSGFKGRRVMRINLSLAMMAAVDKVPNIEIVFGKKLISGVETDTKIQIYFEDGTSATGDLLLGCDGVHSATRMQIVELDRKSHYTGFSFVQTFVPAADIKSHVHFRVTALNISRQGSLLMSFCDRKRQEVFLSAMVQCREEAVKDHQVDQYKQEPHRRNLINESLKREVVDRFGDSAIACIKEVTSMEAEWLLYPIYGIPPGGKWYTGRVLLLGDAAHAMLPRDESAAYALDDAILFSRVLAQYLGQPLESAFEVYDSLRREDINNAFSASLQLWEWYKDAGKTEERLREWILPMILRRRQQVREAAWEFDASKVEIPLLRDSSSRGSSKKR